MERLWIFHYPVLRTWTLCFGGFSPVHKILQTLHTNSGGKRMNIIGVLFT